MRPLDRLLVAGSAVTALRREADPARLGGRRGARQTQDRARELWERLAAHMASAPGHGYERLRRVGALRGHGIDSTRPSACTAPDCSAARRCRPP
ncbi:hypothetical protein [Streptomyces sp. NPDC057386]|uniref:hypothetical protein n=1 Tax=unclassified Streptomyces TaxID=2593676 RepID=UPI0036345D56